MRRGDDSTEPGRSAKPGEDRRPPAAAPGGAGGASPEQSGHATTYVFSREAIRRLDELAIREYGIPSIVLMENAAVGLASGAAEFVGDDDAGTPPGAVLIIAGRGNNGGDGLAAARHLHNEGRQVAIVLAAPQAEYTGDAETNLRITAAMGLPIFVVLPDDPIRAISQALDHLGGGADVVVDALLGTGARGPIGGTLAVLIAQINRLREAGSAVVAADLPSGLDADTGQGLAPAPDGAVRADLTVTFVGLKEGFLTLTAQEFLGEVVVAPIGAPSELIRRLGRPVAVSEYPGERPGEPGRGRNRPPPAPRTPPRVPPRAPPRDH